MFADTWRACVHQLHIHGQHNNIMYSTLDWCLRLTGLGCQTWEADRATLSLQHYGAGSICSDISWLIARQGVGEQPA